MTGAFRRIAVAAILTGTASVIGPIAPVSSEPATGFLSGTVSDSRGTPASGAPVMLYALPSQADLSHLTAGEQAPTILVAQTTTNAAGGYSIHQPSVSLIGRSAGPSGDVNFRLVALTDAMSTFSFSRNVETISSHTTAAQPLSTTAVVNLKTISKMSSTTSAIRPMDNPTTCSTSFLGNIGLVWVVVGQTYSTSPTISHWYTYTNGSSSSLGIGVSGSGTNGSYSSAGTSSTSSTSTTDFPEQIGSKLAYYSSEFEYGRFRTVCTWRGGSSTEYSVQSVDFAGGAKVSRPVSAPSANYCVPYPANAAFHLDTTKAVVWTNGVSIAGLIGIDLSAQTGYSTDSMLNYHFLANGNLCGTGGYPGGPSPYQLVAK